MKKIFYVLLIVSLFSCAPNKEQMKEMKAPIDDLIQNWVDNWNNHDSVAVRNMFLEDAILIENKIICKNADEFSEKWIHPNIHGVHGLETFKLQKWSTTDRAGYVGTYQVKVVHDTVSIYTKGAFTVNWVKTEQNEWKINAAVIHAFNP